MVACTTEATGRSRAECFDRPLRDGHLFLHHFPALRTGLLSLSPLRDESSAHTSKPYVDANGRCRIGYASIQICARPARTAALSVAHFERNDVIIIWETVHTE
jgi:hypothetical protein